MSVDLSGITAGEMADLGAALGCTTFKQVQAKLLSAQAMAADEDLPLDMLVPMMWLSRRAEDHTFTLEMAREMPIAQLAQLAGAVPDPNAGGGTSADSSPTP